VANWYLDLSLVEKYWGDERTYHHTAPISMNYALREALRLIAEEGLESRFARHWAHAEELWVGLEQLGLALFVARENRLPTLTTCQLAQSSEEAIVRRRLLDEFNIEIAGGLGPLKGKVWRIGLMGYSSRRENIACLLAALGSILE
jgi:alanine-glyoxylate transaminase/serine-glyoxylate transaminase/serine-pyruvate transaminase